MKFKKIKIKNIRSYPSEEVDFPDGSFLLSGDVGSGKTSLLLAIEYALFGLQPGQKGSSLLRSNSPSGEVTLEMEIDGKSVVIERKLKRTPRGVSNEYAAIIIDGVKTESSITEIKSKIVSLLGYPQEFVKKNNILYRYTVYTPQEQMKQIILEDAETRLNILRHIFGIDKYKRIRENVLILLAHHKTESKILQGFIATLNDDIENHRKRKENISQIKEKLEEKNYELRQKILARETTEAELKEIEQKVKEREKFIKEIEKSQLLISAKTENLFSLKKEIAELAKNIEEFSQNVDEKTADLLAEQMQTAKEKKETISSLYTEIISKINSFEKENLELLARKERIFQIDLCPTCLQDVPELHKHNILNAAEKKLSEIKRNLGQLETEKNEKRLLIASQNELLQNLAEKKTKFEIIKSQQEFVKKDAEKIQILQKQIQSAENDISLLMNHLDSLKENSLKYSVFQNKSIQKQAELKSVLHDEKNTEITIAELKKELEISGSELSLLEKTILKKEQSKKKLSDLQELMDWLSSDFQNLISFVENNILLRLRNEFSILFRKWFLLLVPDSSFDSRIDENFTPVILQGEAEMDYDFLSGGERTAVALAYRLALNQTLNSFLSKIKTRGLIILDEPTDGFSEEQINKIRDIFDELNARQLIIVSHEQKIESFVDNVLKVTKSGGSSQIQKTSATP